MILDYLRAHIAWSRKTFGEGRKTKSITNHMLKEIVEVHKKPTDLIEWIDIAILAFDGAWRAGHTPEQIILALRHKQSINFGRKWIIPENDEDPIEHERTEP